MHLHAVGKELRLVLNSLRQRSNFNIPAKKVLDLMIDFTRRLKETPVFFIPICKTFHFKEWKPINLQEKTLTIKVANLSKPHLRQGAGSVKVQVVCDQPYKLLKIDVLGYFSSPNLLAGTSLISLIW